MANLTAAGLVESGALPPRVLESCVECMHSRGNLLITGLTGSGKTTLMQALMGLLPADEPLLALDSADELRLERSHWMGVSLYSGFPGSARQIAAAALQWAPCRLVVGGFCPPETGEILRAMACRWRAGSLLGVGAGSADEALRRLAAWAVLDGFDGEAAVGHLAELVDLVVCVRRDPDGSRWIEADQVGVASGGGGWEFWSV